MGHQGGNQLTAQLVNPGVPNAPLSVTVTGKDVTVSLATNAAGAIVEHGRAGGRGAQRATRRQRARRAPPRTAATRARTSPPRRARQLRDNLKAPASIPREPFQMKALRIGKKRDGSKVGVFLYCQEHAREWVTPLACVETAERLLRNYATDPQTKSWSTTSTSSSCRRSTPTARTTAATTTTCSART